MFVVCGLLVLILSDTCTVRAGSNGNTHIGCPTCEHHVCDVNHLMQCDVCQITVLHHHNHLPEYTRCAQAGHCHDDPRTICCNNEACVAQAFDHYYSTTHDAVTTSTSTTAATTTVRAGGNVNTHIGCPTCAHYVCDVNHLMQCEVCQITVLHHHNHLPENTRCVQAGHCHEDTHTICCNNEACVAQAFDHYYQTIHDAATTSTSTTAATTTDLAASSVECPRCLDHHRCDFVHWDRCSVCKIDLHDGQLLHVYCLRATEHCNPIHMRTLCCIDEACIAQAFSYYYSTIHGASTESTLTTAGTPTVHSMGTNMQHTYYTDMFSRLVPCPVCEHGCDVHNAPMCETCNITFHHQQPQATKCTRLGHCQGGNNTICCTDRACVENVFGKVPRIVLTSHDGEIYCPACHDGACIFKCKLCHYQIKDGQLPHFKGCTHQGNHECTHDGHQCCKDYHCIDSLFGSHFQSSIPIFLTSPNPIVTSTTEASTTTTHTTKVTTSQPTHISTATNSTTTHKATTTANTYRISHDHHTTTTTHKSTTKITTTVPSTTDSTPPNGSTSPCTDELNNCLMFKNMGVCHAIPEQGYTYEIAFKCRHTCERCNEIYQPLTTAASTIPTTIPGNRATANGTAGTTTHSTHTPVSTTVTSSSTSHGLICPECDADMKCTRHRTCIPGEVCMIRQFNSHKTVHCSKESDCNFMKMVPGAEIMCCKDQTCVDGILIIT